MTISSITQPEQSESIQWPTMYDLPSDNPEDSGMPDSYHAKQPPVLEETFKSPVYSSNMVAILYDCNLYYDREHPLWYKRPDFMLIVGVPALYNNQDPRLSYVYWDEKVAPLLIVELLSPGTAKEDLGPYYHRAKSSSSNNGVQLELDLGFDDEPEIEVPPRERGTTPKWEVYEKILKVPYYVVYSRYNKKIWFFKLINGSYQLQSLDGKNPLIKIEEIKLSLGLWKGTHAEMNMTWLRWYDWEGNLIPTGREEAVIANQLAESEKQRAESEKQRAESAEQRAQLAEQEAELEKQRAESEKQRAQLAEQEAELEKQRAESEKQRAESAEQEAELAKSKLTQTVLNLARAGMSRADIVNITNLTLQMVDDIINSSFKITP